MLKCIYAPVQVQNYHYITVKGLNEMCPQRFKQLFSFYRGNPSLALLRREFKIQKIFLCSEFIEMLPLTNIGKKTIIQWKMRFDLENRIASDNSFSKKKRRFSFRQKQLGTCKLEIKGKRNVSFYSKSTTLKIKH